MVGVSPGKRLFVFGRGFVGLGSLAHTRETTSFPVGSLLSRIRKRRSGCVKDRLTGMTLTAVARKHRVSRAKVVRLVKETKRPEGDRAKLSISF